MDWLGNFYIIFSCNVLFTASTTLCLVQKFTKKVRDAILDRLVAPFSRRYSVVPTQMTVNNNGATVGGVGPRLQGWKEE